MTTIIWSKQARLTIAQLHSKEIEFSKEETSERKRQLVRLIEDKVITNGAKSRRATSGEWMGSYVIIAEGYWVFYSYPPNDDVVFVEAVVHSRQMTIRPI